MREGLKRIVAGCSDMTVVGAATSPEEVLERVQATGAELLLLDLLLGGPKLRALVRELKQRHAGCRVLVLNVQGEDPDALRILGTGAAGYIGRDYSRRQLLDAIRQVARGASYVSPSLASTFLASTREGAHRPRHDVLSEREYQVLCLFGSGIPFKQIAAQLGVSPKTVSTYRGRILDKLKLTSNAAIIRYAIEHRVVPASGMPSSRRKKSTTGRPARV